MYDCLIIGGGPCGVACAIYLKQAGYNVAIIENELVGGQPLQTNNITNVVGFIGNGQQFGDILNKQLLDSNIEVIYNEAIMKDNKVYIDNQLLEAKTIVIATGASPIQLDKIKKAHYCALCDGILYKDKEVIIIGSGNSAYTEALHLSNICKKVTMLQDVNFPILANNELINSVMNKNNIIIIQYNDIISDNQTSLSILYGNKIVPIAYDGLFAAIGRKPNIEWIEDMDEFRVNSNYNVIKKGKALKNIFAGGDVINKPIKQISTAINDGVVISQNIIRYLEEND